MPSLVKLRKGKRYQFANTLVQHGEVVEVDNRTRNRLVKSGYFIDVSEHERPAFIAKEEDDGPAQVQGGTELDNYDDPALTGAKPDVSSGPVGSRGEGKVHSRGNAEAVEAAAQQTTDPAAEKTEAAV